MAWYWIVSIGIGGLAVGLAVGAVIINQVWASILNRW